MSVSNAPLQLNYAQIRADLMMAKRAMEDAAVSGKSLAKYLRGQSGYHLQQAVRKNDQDPDLSIRKALRQF